MGYKEYQARVAKALSGKMDGDIVRNGNAQFKAGMIEVCATLLCYNPVYDKEHEEFVPLHIETIHQQAGKWGLSLKEIYRRQQEMLRGIDHLTI